MNKWCVTMLNRDFYHKLEEIRLWCLENIGDGGYGYGYASTPGVWYMDTAFGYTTFGFRKQSDLVLFTLRWVNDSSD